jgi:hypothetical protein
MAIKTINAQTGLSDFTIGQQSYKAILDRVGIASEKAEEDEVRFDIEATGAEFGLGATISRLTLEGVIRYGDAGTVPFTPPDDFQGDAFVATFTTGCTVSGTLSMVRTDLNNQAGRIRRFTAMARCSGALVVAWDEGDSSSSSSSSA